MCLKSLENSHKYAKILTMNNDFLKTLNPKQREAVEKIYGQVLVLAGPGTGKTHMLTARIANILEKTDTKAQNILCLTFTNSAAIEMRDRLQKVIGSDAYLLKISTFHGFCEWVMEQNPAKFSDIIQNSEVADDLQQALIFEEIINSRKWEYFNSPFDDFFWKRDILGSIGKMKQENFNPKKFRGILPAEKKILEENPDNFYKRKYRNFAAGDMKPNAQVKIDHKIGKLEEFADFWEIYEQKLAKKGLFDFNDQINWVVEALENDENLRLDLMEQFQFVLVDEYQDTNNSQNKILWALTNYEDPNVFAVGDDDQSIYRFQGASVANVAEFRQRFPNRLEVTLEENYRSTQTVLDTAYTVVEKNTERSVKEKKLVSKNPRNFSEKKIQKIEISSQYLEMNFLIEKIREKLANGTAPNDMAILVRKNSEIADLARFLPKFGIPVAAEVFKNILDNKYVIILDLMMQIFANPKNDEKLLNLLHSPFWKISREFLAEISITRNAERLPMLEFLLKFATENEPNNPDKVALSDFLNFFTQSRKDFFHCRPRMLAEKLVYESGLMDFLVREKDLESFSAINKFLSWISQQGKENLEDVLELVELHRKLNIKISPDPLPADKRAVRIMTAHKSKGMEFDIVFIPGLIDKNWGNKRSFAKIPLPHLVADKDFDENEEERRLFFVALTRARQEIYLSFSKFDFSGREKSPSIFWHEIPAKFSEIIDGEEFENAEILPTLMYSGNNLQLTSGEQNLLSQKVKNFAWSASALNNYMECPRRFLFQNLYKFPRKPNSNMAFGVAMHEALERFLRDKATELSELLGKYEHALRGQNLAKKEFNKILDHGKTILEKYFIEKLADGNFSENHFKLEFDFKKYHPHIDEIPLVGRADKIVFTDDSLSSAKIVDYKSGKPKPIKKGERNWRQLVFYDLLAKNSQGILWAVNSCELEFLSPKDEKFITHTYQVTEDDRQSVIAELKDADQKIKNFEFPLVENPRNDEDIEFWQNLGK